MKPLKNTGAAQEGAVPWKTSTPVTFELSL
jgi:hypothetical protein